MPRFLGAVVAVCLLSLASGFAVPSAQRSRPTIVELLDRYAKHDFEAPVSLAGVTPDDAGKVVQELELKGADWASALGPRETPGRRLIAATFALDLVRVWSTSPFDRRWRSSQRLLVWGCGQLRRNNVPLAGERWWHLAAIGLFEGRQDASALIGDEVKVPAFNHPLADGPTGHVSHALARFPGEARFRLAQVVSREVAVWFLEGWSRAPTRPRTGALPPEISDAYIAGLTEAARPVKTSQRINYNAARRVTDQLDEIKLLREARRLSEPLLGMESIAGEAHLRYGYRTLQLGERTIGLDHLIQAEALLTDPVLLYLARLFRASAHERMDQPSEAIAAYRRALELAPHARTASLALTSLLIRESRVSEASDVAGQLLSNPGAVDPISRYRTGDYRLVADYLEQLRRVLP